MGKGEVEQEQPGVSLTTLSSSEWNAIRMRLIETLHVKLRAFT